MRGHELGGVSDSDVVGFVADHMIFRWLGGFAIALIGALACSCTILLMLILYVSKKIKDKQD